MQEITTHSLEVALGERSYPIIIGSGLLADIDSLRCRLADIVRGRQVLVVSNPTVFALYGDRVQSALADYQVDVFKMDDGEQYKSLDTYARLMDFLLERQHNRTTCIIALGGGVVGDLAGFAAATYQRGVDFVQIPTTLLAQVDSSVGGKTAVNHPRGKNMVGAFYQPKAVIIDTQVLDSLPSREFSAGLAEVVKYGVIADADFFAWLEAHQVGLVSRDAEALVHSIRRSVEIKAEVVAQDERESGIRAILNFGHTFGHAIESLTGYDKWLHGEAVAIGMVMAGGLSERMHLLNQGDRDRLRTLLVGLNLPVELESPLPAADMLAAMALDKKTVDGRLTFILAESLGSARVVADVDSEVVTAVLADSGLDEIGLDNG